MSTPLDSILGQAIQAFQKGDYAYAEKLLEKILQVQKNNLPALHILGLIKASQENHLEASKFLKKAAALNPQDASLQYNLAKALANSNKHQEAILHHEKATRLMPANPEAWVNFGMSLTALHRHQNALEAFDKALEINPQFPEALLNKGLSLKALNICDPLPFIENALKLKPSLFEAWLAKGVILREQNHLDEALTCFDVSLKINPNHLSAWLETAQTLQSNHRLNEALNCYHKAAEIDPNNALCHYKMGHAFYEIDNYPKAIEHFNEAIQLNPKLVDIYAIRGLAKGELKEFGEAIKDLTKAIKLFPDKPALYISRGSFFELQNRFESQSQTEQAISDFHKALSLDPKNAEAKWCLAFSCIPPVITNNQEITSIRAKFNLELDNLGSWLNEGNIPDAYKAVGLRQPFFLAYQEINNNQIISRYGDICYRVMSYWQSENNLLQKNVSPDSSQKFRVGIVSKHIFNHSVWNAIVKGLVENLNHEEFEIHIFYLSNFCDSETETAKSLATSFTQKSAALIEWATDINIAQLDALIYPEIGMDPLTCQLANLRLSPIQISLWGHPETTGLPTIDYYVSAENFEPENADHNYREKLLKLPNLGCFYKGLNIPPKTPDLPMLGLSYENPILICPGTHFKYAPEFDWVFTAIAKRLNKCQFIFFTNKERAISILFKNRLQKVFEDEGLIFEEYVHFIPWQSSELLYGLFKIAAVFLDTIGFSGFNTAMQAIECDLPIVTREGLFMRGRLASGILKRMGLDELIANDEDCYIDLVVKLVQDHKFNQTIRLKAKQSKDKLFYDLSPIKALEAFLINQINKLRYK
ncbi:tetratricopeptide repeat protein [Polynucleobacter sp. MWH-UH19D]|uniref:tetratricopeptide repeat protein n=1 Tax=Polynucleobacter sp. MWH-UH19D TaxID=1855610 RepID=UPI003364CA66